MMNSIGVLPSINSFVNIFAVLDDFICNSFKTSNCYHFSVFFFKILVRYVTSCSQSICPWPRVRDDSYGLEFCDTGAVVNGA